MANIPDPYNRKRETGRSNRAIVRDNSAVELAASITNTLKRREERKDRFAYANARASLLTADIETRRELEDDEDWSTYEERYTEAMSEHRDSALSEIRNGDTRKLFELESQLSVERGLDDVRALSKKREVDWGRGVLDDQLESLREAAMGAPDEETRIAIVDNAMDLIVGAKESRYIDDLAAAKMRKAWAADYAEGYVSMQTPEKRIELLSKPKGTPAELLRTDQRKEMLEAAKKEGNALRVRTESQAKADGFMDKYSERSDALAAARKIADPEVRDQTVTRINNRFNEVEKIDDETRRQRMIDASALIADGTLVADLPAKILGPLGADEIKNLEALQRYTWSDKEPVHSDTKYYEWTQLPTDKQLDVNLMSEYRPYVDDQHFNAMVSLQQTIKQAHEGDAASKSKLEEVGSTNQRITNAIVLSGVMTKPSDGDSDAKKQRYARIHDEMRRAVEAVSAQAGRQLTPAELDEVIDPIAMRHVFVRKVFSDPQKFGVELESDEIADAYVPFDDIPEDRRRRLLNYSRSKGWNSSKKQIEKAYALGLLNQGSEAMDAALQGQ